MTELSGQMLTPAGLLPGRLVLDGGRIGAVVPDPDVPKDRLYLPGFIDSHVHGGAGGDTMDGAAGIATLARFHGAHGSTTVLPTTITNPWARVTAALAALRDFQTDERLPDLPGAHLEGPFISPDRLGAQPPNALDPTSERVAEVLSYGVIRAVTLAPELPGAAEAAVQFARAGVRVSLGHTAGRYEDALRVMRAVWRAGGEVGGTHLYNAMGSLSGREPGVLGALLAQPLAYSELILDGHHVHAGSFLAAYRAKPERLTLITDAIRAAGMPDGSYDLGGQMARVKDGVARLDGGSLAGSVLTLDVALRNAVMAGLSLAEASRLLSLNPARYLGLHDRGELRPGLRADVVELNPALEVKRVWVAGQPLTA